MSGPKTAYSSPPGPVGAVFTDLGIAHAASIPLSGTTRLVITSGEPGLDIHTGTLVTSSLEAQIHAAFDTVDLVLRHAGVPDGVRAAHKFTALLLDMRKDEEVLMRVFGQRYPGHTPVFMAFGVKELGMEGMRVELRAEAVVFGGD